MILIPFLKGRLFYNNRRASPTYQQKDLALFSI